MDQLTIKEIQDRDADVLGELVVDTWKRIRANRVEAKVTPGILKTLPEEITRAPYPEYATQLSAVLEEFYNYILPNCVNSSNPLFLGYVTPPALDVTFLGNAIIAMLNQNVSFSALSPAGTAIENYVIETLSHIVGYRGNSGGVLVSGGSMANLQALITARRFVLGGRFAKIGNAIAQKSQRVYCSVQIHRSIQKAAMLMGIGVENVIEIPCDKEHRIDIKVLRERITEDFNHGHTPIAIVGAAGTRVCGAFDPLNELADIAQEYSIWFHVDGAFGAFLRLADDRPPELDALHRADSVTLDPHKLLFIPMDSGCLLVKDRQSLINAFGSEGEYLEKFHPVGQDYCDYGIQLGRSMKAFNIWLAFKYIGLETYKREFQRLIYLAEQFTRIIQDDPHFELIGPAPAIIVCFRWKGKRKKGSDQTLNIINERIRTALIKKGIAFINGVMIEDQFALRACFTNFNTSTEDLKKMLTQIKSLQKDDDHGD